MDWLGGLEERDFEAQLAALREGDAAYLWRLPNFALGFLAASPFPLEGAPKGASDKAANADIGNEYGSFLHLGSKRSIKPQRVS